MAEEDDFEWDDYEAFVANLIKDTGFHIPSSQLEALNLVFRIEIADRNMKLMKHRHKNGEDQRFKSQKKNNDILQQIADKYIVIAGSAFNSEINEAKLAHDNAKILKELREAWQDKRELKEELQKLKDDFEALKNLK